MNGGGHARSPPAAGVKAVVVLRGGSDDSGGLVEREVGGARSLSRGRGSGSASTNASSSSTSSGSTSSGRSLPAAEDSGGGGGRGRGVVGLAGPDARSHALEDDAGASGRSTDGISAGPEGGTVSHSGGDCGGRGSHQEGSSVADRNTRAGGDVGRGLSLGRGLGRGRRSSNPAAPQPTTADERATASTVAGAGGGGAASPAHVGRFLSAPFGVLSAVGAWATGRGRSSTGSAASDTAAAVAAAATAEGATGGVGGACGRKSPGRARDQIAGRAAGSEAKQADLAMHAANGKGVTEPSQDRRRDNDGGGEPDSTPYARGSELKLDLAGHDGEVDVGRSRPPDSLDQDREEKAGTRALEKKVAGEAVKGKRKPECSPAVTPDGPSPVRNFGFADLIATGDGQAPSEKNSRGEVVGSGRSGRAAPALEAAAVDDAGWTETRVADSRRCTDAEAVEKTADAFPKAHNATARWREGRAPAGGGGGGGGAGTRRGKPHPRGTDEQADDDAALSANPWLATTGATERGSRDRARRLDSYAVGGGGAFSSYGGDPAVVVAGSDSTRSGTCLNGGGGGHDAAVRPTSLPGNRYRSISGSTRESSPYSAFNPGAVANYGAMREDSGPRSAVEREGRMGGGAGSDSAARYHSRTRLREVSGAAVNGPADPGHVRDAIDGMPSANDGRHHSDRQPYLGVLGGSRPSTPTGGLYEPLRQSSYGRSHVRVGSEPTPRPALTRLPTKTGSELSGVDGGGGRVIGSSLVARRWATVAAAPSSSSASSNSRATVAVEEGSPPPSRDASEIDLYRPKPNSAILDAARRGASFSRSMSAARSNDPDYRRPSDTYAGAATDLAGTLSGRGDDAWRQTSRRGSYGRYRIGDDQMAVDGGAPQRRGAPMSASAASLSAATAVATAVLAESTSWREKEIARLNLSGSQSSRRSPTPPPTASRRTDSMRRNLEGPGSTAASATSATSAGVASRRASTSSISSSLLSNSRLGSSSAVPGAVARGGGSSRGSGAFGTGGAGSGLGSTYESQTLSSLRRRRAAEERRALEAGGAARARKTYDTSKFF